MAAPINRKQFAYYVRVSFLSEYGDLRGGWKRHGPAYGLRRAWNHFWASRWWWSNGWLSIPPLHHQSAAAHPGGAAQGMSKWEMAGIAEGPCHEGHGPTQTIPVVPLSSYKELVEADDCKRLEAAIGAINEKIGHPDADRHVRFLRDLKDRLAAAQRIVGGGDGA